MKKRLSLQEYEEGIRAGNRGILSQAITLVESSLESDRNLASSLVQNILNNSGKSIRIGITGVPGVGKSTFIEAFGKTLLELGKKVAVLAVDPSSQMTKGSILGDKTRMEELSLDKRAFIRPSPSGRILGGVSGKTREVILLCEAAGFDVIIIETVGVGQSETAVKNMVDFFLLLMLAGAGDELQGIKKGIMEMADLVIIHKADGDNLDAAKKAKSTYQNTLHYFQDREKNWTPKVVLSSSISGLGITEVWALIRDYEEKIMASGFWELNRSNQRIQWLEELIQEQLNRAFFSDRRVKEILTEEKEKVKEGKLYPEVLAKKLLGVFIENHPFFLRKS